MLRLPPAFTGKSALTLMSRSDEDTELPSLGVNLGQSSAEVGLGQALQGRKCVCRSCMVCCHEIIMAKTRKVGVQKLVRSSSESNHAAFSVAGVPPA